jgi:hypothetical protein
MNINWTSSKFKTSAIQDIINGCHTVIDCLPSMSEALASVIRFTVKRDYCEDE